MQKSSVTARGLIGLSLGLAVALTAPMAVAKGKKADSSAKKSATQKKKLLVGGFDGPKADQARKAVIAALKEDGEYDVSDSSSVKPGADDKSYAKASGGAAAVLVGTMKKGKGLVLSVHNGADGALIQDVEIKGDSAAKLNKSIDATLAVSVADAVSQAKAGSGDADAEPAKEEKDKSDDSEAPTKDSAKGSDDKEAEPEKKSEPEGTAHPGPSPLEFTAGLRAVHRSFTYHDTPAQLFPNSGQAGPLSYQLPLGPAIFFDATVYPAAFFSKGAAGNFGITGGYEANFATKSVYAENTPAQKELTTRATQYFVGLRGRIPLGAQEFGLVVAYGQQTFNLLGDEAAPLVPDVAYKFIRLGADARLHFDDLTIGFHVGTRLVSDVGGLKSAYWFPNTKTQSLEAGLYLGYKVVSHLDVLGGVDLTRYAFNFNPLLGPCASPAVQPCQDPTRAAGGAVDQYISGWLGLRYTMPNHASD